MANQNQSGPDPAFRMGARTPEELERFAALFVPVWDLPPDVPTNLPDPGFRAAPVDPALAAQFAAPAMEPPKPTFAATMVEVATAAPEAQKEQPRVPPKTMIGLSAAEMPPAAEMMAMAQAQAPTVPQPAVPAEVFAQPPQAMAQAMAPAPQAAVRPMPSTRPAPVDDFADVPRKKSPLIFIAIGGVVAAAAVGAFFLTRGEEPAPKKDKSEETVSTSKKADLPDPASVAADKSDDTPKKAKADKDKDKEPEPKKAAEPEPEPKKAAEPEPKKSAEPEPKKTAEPPVAVAPPPPKSTAVAPPPAYTAPKVVPPPAATGKKPPPKIKDDF